MDSSHKPDFRRKMQGFLTRALICFALSLIPLADLESWIYSLRLGFRLAQPGPQTPVLIVSLTPNQFSDPAEIRRIQSILRTRGQNVLVASREQRELRRGHGWGPSGAPTQKRKILSLAMQALVLAGRPAPAGLDPLPSSSCQFSQTRAIPGLPTECRRPPEAPGSGFHSKSTDLCADPKNAWVVLAEETEPEGEVRTPVGELSRDDILIHDLVSTVDGKPLQEAASGVRWIASVAMIVAGALMILDPSGYCECFSGRGHGLARHRLRAPAFLDYWMIYIPTANISLALLITYLIFTGYRLATQENLRWRAFQTAETLRELDELKSNFLSLVSHDLKTPIAKIQALTDRLAANSPCRLGTARSGENI